MLECLINCDGERHLEWRTREAFRISFTIPGPKLFNLLMCVYYTTLLHGYAEYSIRIGQLGIVQSFFSEWQTVAMETALIVHSGSYQSADGCLKK